MIRFLDKEVYCVEKKDINRSGLFSYFCKKEHNDDIILVYDEGIYYGYINYQTLLGTAAYGEEAYIVKEKYIHKKDDVRIWENLHILLKDLEERGIKRQAFVPIFDEQGQLLYFAYEYVKEPDTSYVDIALAELQEKRAEIFLKDMYRQMASVCIEDCNEWAYLFSDVLEMYGVPYFCEGEKWQTLFPTKPSALDDCEYGRMKIYAEGIEYFKKYGSGQFLESWNFLVKLCQANHLVLSEKLKHELQSKGVNVRTMYFPLESKSKTQDEEIRRLHGVIPQEKSWENELDRGQIEKILGKGISWEKWVNIQTERRQKHAVKFHVKGKTLESKVFGDGKGHIYIIGPCIAIGYCVLADEESIGYLLAEKLKAKDYSVQCIMYPLNCYILYEDIINSLTLMENDIVVIVDLLGENGILQYKSDFPIADLIKSRTGRDWFWDTPIHATATGCLEIANAMVNWLEPLVDHAVNEHSKCLQMGDQLLQTSEEEKLNAYIAEVKRYHEIEKGDLVGAIVMNCNPMTKGHLYLIDYARQRVKWLYIFVVQEDKSAFSFEDRFAMVEEATRCFDNVIVVPSGEFVLSYTTMPLYFEKEEKKEETLDATRDLTVFGGYVARELGISKRFVGAEPQDAVTRQYNEAMKRILPNYGVEVEEIERLKIDAKTVSASLVRRWIEEGRWQEIEKVVPDTVYKRLRLG